MTSVLPPGATQISQVDGMVLHYVPAGTFMMGDTAEHASAECQKTGPSPDGCKLDRFTDEEPVHQVYLDAFWMDETEVTNAMYNLCVKAGVCYLPTTLDYYPHIQFADYPVVFVTWDDAKAYCEWVGRRLPTEAEWEKAARGTDGRTYPWGEEIGKDYANYNLYVGDATVVGSYELGKSPYGLYDMSGNVFEFVADWYHPDYYKTLGETADNPKGPSNGQSHVAKGGGFLYNSIRPADRDARDRATNEDGFRCVLSAGLTTAHSEIAQTPAPADTPSVLPTEITDAKGVSMVLVPTGDFLMGSYSDNAYSECQKFRDYCVKDWFINVEPMHNVYLDAYYIDIFEVTNSFYKDCVEAGVCEAPKDSSFYKNSNYYDKSQFENYPVISVDWHMADTYCKWRGVRLPTEAEWEKAARGTDGRTYPWGERAECSKSNYDNCLGYITEVGSYKADKSPYSVYDMGGNASEWVVDWYQSNYYDISPIDNPQGPEPKIGINTRVVRGGSWNGIYAPAVYLRGAARPSDYATNPYIGFRCAKDAAP
jgi:formylglycine-generating enzyme required for sulfatase activity